MKKLNQQKIISLFGFVEFNPKYDFNILTRIRIILYVNYFASLAFR